MPVRNFRSISNYLSLGTLNPADLIAPPRPALMGARVTGIRPFERNDLVVAEHLTVKHIRTAVDQLARDGVPPIPNVGRTVLRGLVDADTGERFRVDEDPAALDFGPYYEVNVPPADMTVISAEPAFQAGLASGEFRVAGAGRILVRPPRGEA
jgi:hypothetical protein